MGQAAARELEEAILREGADTVAAFIGEPIHGAGGVFYPTDDYWPRVREVCTRHDVLLIADEIITGFCRTGRWFGLSHWNVHARHPVVRQGRHLGLSAARRHHGDARDQGGDGRGQARGPLDARLHLLGPSDLLRGRAEEHRDHGARAAARARGAHGRRLHAGLKAAFGDHPHAATSAAARGCWPRWSSWRIAATKKNFPAELKVAPALQTEMMKRGVITRTRPAAEDRARIPATASSSRRRS